MLVMARGAPVVWRFRLGGRLGGAPMVDRVVPNTGGAGGASAERPSVPSFACEF